MAFNIQQGVQTALGSLNLPGALSGTLQVNPANTTTAINLLVVINGVPQGLIQSMRIDETFNLQRLRAIGNAVNAAIIPGVYEATGTISKLFLFGLTLDQAFGGQNRTARPVLGKYLRSPNFTLNYFNIVVSDSRGFPLMIHHDCVLAAESKAYDANNVIIMEDAQVLIRWTEAT